MPRDFFHRAADVNGGCAGAIGGSPRNRSVERPIDFEYARSVFELTEAFEVARRQFIWSDRRELSWRDIEDHDAALRNVAHRMHRRGCANLAAQRSKSRGQ